MRSRSGSATSNTSSKSKELSADNMAIQVNIGGGKTIKLNVRPIHTVSNVLEFLSASTTLPVDVRLTLDDKPLEPSSTVGDLKLEESSTLQLSPPIRSSTPTEQPTPAPSSTEMTSKPSTPAPATPTKKKSNKPRCSKQACKAPAQPIVGDCGFCQKRFCGKHRMLESHNCEGLEEARRMDKERNAAKLEGERTVMLRGL